MFCQLPFKVSIYNAFERDILVRAPDCGSGGRRFETALPPGIIKGFRNETLFFGTKFGTNVTSFWSIYILIGSILMV